MNLVNLKIIAFSVALLGLVFLISACNITNPNLSEPPLPTIVPVTPTVTPQPPAPVETVAQPEPAATNTQPAGQPTRQNQAQEESATSTPAPLPTATQPSPTETPAPTIAPTDTPAAGLPPLDSIELQLLPVVGGFTKPVYLTHAGDGSERLFVVEQAGRILILTDGVTNPTPFLDIIERVGSDGLEQGLLSVAFHPDYSSNGQFFVNYTNRQGNTVVARYNVSNNPGVADPASEKILLTIQQPYGNHNGGQVIFGPDGYLYIGMGDGGAANDPQNRAQDLGTLLGKILRIDVNSGDPYGVPQTNPFVNNNGARPEIWSYGWRNPWRFSFDATTNDMYIADVGQNQYEEVHVEWAGQAGRNYGWRLMEGAHCHIPADCDPEAQNLALPITEYDHSLGCSITGGYVYRGAQYPALTGIYFYGDFCSGRIWGLRYESDNSWSEAQFMQSDTAISSFGQDEAGELYLLDHKGDIFMLGH